MFFSLNLRTLRELSLGFGTIKASSWRCSGQLPGVSPVFDRTETILGEIFFPPRQASKAVSGSDSPPRARSRVRYHQCIFLALQRSNTGGLPVFDRAETVLGEIFSPLARLPELSLGALPPREHALGFGIITASSWRCSGLIPGVSPVFDRTENYSGGNLFPTRQAPRAVSGSASPPRARSRVRYHHGIFLAL